MIKSNCFTHQKKKASGTCSYCKAAYCSTCLKLIGDNDEVICGNCHATLAQQFYQSMLKRKKYIYIGYVFLVFSIYIVAFNFGETSGYFGIILFMFILGLILITKKRINEMKSFLQAKAFVK